MSGKFEVILNEEQAHDRLLEPRRKFGPGDPNHVDDGNVQAWLGTRPVVYDIRKLIKGKNIQRFQLLEHHEIWLAYYSVGITQQSNLREVVAIRLEVQYEEDPRITI